MSKDTWIVVANRSVARLMKYERPGQPLTELETITHPPGRLHEGDLVSDKPGRAFDSQGQGRHAETTDVLPSEHEADKFAVEVAERLRMARVEHECDALVLIAAPAFLGTLRDHLDDATRKLVIQEIDKNLAHHDASQIQQQLSA